jgi:cytochrome c peroxidase
MRSLATLTLLVAVAASPGNAASEALVPLTGEPPYPANNPPTAEKIELGKKLFFDTRLSGANGRSCGTCHRPELMYADGLSRAWSLKESELRRKTPSLFNVAWQQRMFHDARAGSLEEQAAFPLRNDLEMDLDPEVAAERIRQDPEYQKLFAAVFPGQALAWDRIAQAMAAFERTLVSRDSPLDRYLAGDQKALNAAAQRGLAVFSGEAGCIQCHHGPLLSNQQMYYIGVPEMMGDVAGSKYKTAPLRDVASRASYMHNGIFRNLDEVLKFYESDRGADAEAPRLKITPAQKADLLEFLRSLSGQAFSVDEPVGTYPFGIGKGSGIP